MTDLTDQLDAIQARVDAATPGPWEFSGPDLEQCEAGWNTVIENTVSCSSYCYGGSVEQTVKPADKAFIAAAPTDIGFLLVLARKQQAGIDAVEDWMRNLDVVEEMDPTTPTNRNCSAGGVASVVRAVIREALEAKP